MSTVQKPSSVDQERETTWGRIRAAFRRDWEQTKHDFGVAGLDMHQDIGDTLAQAAGKHPFGPLSVPVSGDVEPAFRFGYVAHTHYAEDFPEWNAELESQLETEWTTAHPNERNAWSHYRPAVFRGWEYRGSEMHAVLSHEPGERKP